MSRPRPKSVEPARGKRWREISDAKSQLLPSWLQHNAPTRSLLMPSAYHRKKTTSGQMLPRWAEQLRCRDSTPRSAMGLTHRARPNRPWSSRPHRLCKWNPGPSLAPGKNLTDITLQMYPVIGILYSRTWKTFCDPEPRIEPQLLSSSLHLSSIRVAPPLRVSRLSPWPKPGGAII